jgi:2-keto-myo-inositol isomerase
MPTVSFALNHMCAPRQSIAEFFAMARALGCDAVEIRNDLDNNAILDGTEPEAIAAEAGRAGLRIISINALQRFNEWNTGRQEEAEWLIDFAARSGAEALVLVPTNDGTGLEADIRRRNLRQALSGLKPLLDKAGIIGLVEPLGFESCSLRSKTEASEAIRDIAGEGTFKLVHDTFHHHLAGEPQIHAEMTGLVHISGVEDTALAVSEMRDAHRLLVGAADRIDNSGQIIALQAAGYAGYFSFEPFAAEVHEAASPSTALANSMAFIRSAIAASATSQKP